MESSNNNNKIIAIEAIVKRENITLLQGLIVYRDRKKKHKILLHNFHVTKLSKENSESVTVEFTFAASFYFITHATP